MKIIFKSSIQFFYYHLIIIQSTQDLCMYGKKKKKIYYLHLISEDIDSQKNYLTEPVRQLESKGVEILTPNSPILKPMLELMTSILTNHQNF